MKTPDYLSYERYKKKKDNNSNKRISIFLTTFFITLLLFTVIAKSLSPDVDVTIGDTTETDAKETGLGVKRFIDDRLKIIQMEDTTAGVSVKGENKKSHGYNDESFDKYSQEAVEEEITLPSSAKNKKTKPEDEEDLVEDEAPIHPTIAPPRPKSRDLNNSVQSTKMSKVYVGRYSTLEQAKVSQEILMDSGLGITPFVKDFGNYYTLQIGSYSSRAKADGLASELQRNGYPARVVQE